jgi:hypothetical protein
MCLEKQIKICSLFFTKAIRSCEVCLNVETFKKVTFRAQNIPPKIFGLFYPLFGRTYF